MSRVRRIRGVLVVAALCASASLTGCADVKGASNTPARAQRPTAFYGTGLKGSVPQAKSLPRVRDEFMHRKAPKGPRVGDVRTSPIQPEHGSIAAPASGNLDRVFDEDAQGKPEKIGPPKGEDAADAAEDGADEKSPAKTGEVPPGQGVYHVVRKGDTIAGLSRMYGVSTATIKKWNAKEVEEGLPVGATVYLPGAKPPKAIKPVGVPGEAKPEKVVSFRPKPGPEKFQWPVQGTVLSRFGMRSGRLHTGVDLAAPQGTPIHAARGGKVIYAGQMNGYGNVVILDHLDGYFSVYGHNSENLVSVTKGAAAPMVRAGQVIARVGQTGNATRPHVHFEIRRSNDAMDPLPLLSRPVPPDVAGVTVESRRG